MPKKIVIRFLPNSVRHIPKSNFRIIVLYAPDCNVLLDQATLNDCAD